MYHRIQITAALLTAIVLLAPGCGSTPDETEEEQQFIGAPPQQEDDPLFRHALPAEAVPADPTGRVGVTEEEPDDEPDEVAAVDEPDEPMAPDAEPPPEIPDDRPACFSCVRICPVGDDGVPECPDHKDDLICGWGSHRSDPDQARRMAEAQCEESLDMARYLPTYTDIAGECPSATCR